MRRLVAYCVPALLFLALPTPSRASNDGIIVFTPPQPQAAESGSGGAPPPSQPYRPCAGDMAAALSKRC